MEWCSSRLYALRCLIFAGLLSTPAHGILLAQHPTGTILGRVVDGVSNRPIAGAIVILRPATATSGPAAQPPSRRVVSDKQGRFVFRSVSREVYFLEAVLGGNGFGPAGFRISNIGQASSPYLPGAYGALRPDGQAQSIDLKEIDSLPDAVIRMWKGAAITGAVYDHAGEALVNVVVAAVRKNGSGRLTTGPTARTDDRGVFRLGTLSPGRYVVVVPHSQYFVPSSLIEQSSQPASRDRLGRLVAASGGSLASLAGIGIGDVIGVGPSGGSVTNFIPIAADVGSRPMVYRSTYYPSTFTAADAQEVRLAPGEERLGVDIHLRPIVAGTVSGLVSGPTGMSVGAVVRLTPSDSADDGSGFEVATTLTDSRGLFRFPRVPEGSYLAKVEFTDPLDGGLMWANASVTAQSRNGEGPPSLSLALRPGATIAGGISLDSSSSSTAMLPLPRTQILVRRIDRASRTQASDLRANTDAAGKFRLPGLVPGRYQIRVNVAAPFFVQSTHLSGRDITDEDFDVMDDISDVSIKLTDKVTTVTGSVRRPDGNPDEAASVWMFPVDRARWTESRLTFGGSWRAMRVSQRGTFRIQNISPGDYYFIGLRDDQTAELGPAAFSKIVARASRVRVNTGEHTSLLLTTEVVK